MGVHADFRRMVDIMYKDSTLQIKVNGHVGESFHPTNAVAQGSPLSPLLYLLVIQSFVSLINVSNDMPEDRDELGAIPLPKMALRLLLQLLDDAQRAVGHGC